MKTIYTSLIFTFVAASMAFAQKPKLTQSWASDPVFKTPESVCYDKDRNVLYVSNINENPWEDDGNGFISKIKPNGEIIKLEWVSGLNAPKGMGVFDNTLYVTDNNDLIEIDIEKGAIVKTHHWDANDKFNDVSIASDGTVWFTDSGNNKIYFFKNGERTLFLDEGLDNCNGIFIEKNRVLIAGMGSEDVAAYDLKDKSKTTLATDTGKGDGIVPTHKKGYYLLSGWNGVISLVTPKGEFISLLNAIEQEIQAADIDYIIEEKLLFVPTFYDNRVFAYTLEF